MRFLEAIVAEKRAQVAARAELLPFEELAQRVRTENVRDFRGAIARSGAIIAELKARTPNIVTFAHSERLLALAETYARYGASAISIVTDAPRFGTSLDDVTRVRDTTPLPVIAKDFIVDPYQILEARAAGADAVLLIVRLLDGPGLRSLLDFAAKLGLAVLVEVHTEGEVFTALDAGAEIVGINNRDLDTMTVSLDVTRRLAPLVPPSVPLVSESGIRTRFDMDDLIHRGVRAFLIGRSLLDAPDPRAKLQEFVGKAGRPHRSVATGRKGVS